MSYIGSVNPVPYIPGQIVDSNPYSILSLPNTTASTIPYGIAMIFDSANTGYKSPTSSGDITNRMAVNLIINRNKLYSTDSSLNPTIIDNNGTPAGQESAGMIFGNVAVFVEEDVLVGQQCFIRYAAGTGGTQLGAFRASANSSTAAAHPSWYYTSSATAGTKATVCVR